MPVDGRGTVRFADERRQVATGRANYDIYPGTQDVPPNAGPIVLNRTHSITTYATVPDGGGEGMLFRHGSTDGGYALHMKNVKLQCVHHFCAIEYFNSVSPDFVGAGEHEPGYGFEDMSVLGDASSRVRF